MAVVEGHGEAEPVVGVHCPGRFLGELAAQDPTLGDLVLRNPQQRRAGTNHRPDGPEHRPGLL